MTEKLRGLEAPHHCLDCGKYISASVMASGKEFCAVCYQKRYDALPWWKKLLLFLES